MRYRSNLERDFHRRHPTARYEPHRIPYTVTHHYVPDFVLPDGTIVETKGRFTGAARAKHLHLKKQHPDLKVTFVFQNAHRRLSAKSKVTYAEWCDKHGFDWEEQR